MAAVATLEKLGAGPVAGASPQVTELEQACYDAMNDDLNTPIMIAHLFDGVRMINSANDGKLGLHAEDVDRLRSLYNTMLFDVLGLRKEQESAGNNEALDGVVQLLLSMRADAKISKNFTLSDKIRDQLAAVGIIIKDTKDGSTWEHA